MSAIVVERVVQDHAEHGDLLAYRDSLITRCTCGAWTWLGRCGTETHRCPGRDAA